METATERLRTKGDGSRACEDVRQDLCRLAVDAPTSAPVALLAHHARRCDACASYVDALARARRRLDQGLREAGAEKVTPTALEGRARTALARELSSRLARDLHDLGAGGECRPGSVRRRDLQRLRWLAGPFDRDPWPVASRLVAESERPINRRLALRLATALDPLGLDVAIGHLQALERTGRAGLANAETDRLLGLLG